MKNELTAVILPLSKNEIKALCSEVKETALSAKQAKTFTAADLWYIHKNRKTTTIKAGAF